MCNSPRGIWRFWNGSERFHVESRIACSIWFSDLPVLERARKQVSGAIAVLRKVIVGRRGLIDPFARSPIEFDVLESHLPRVSPYSINCNVTFGSIDEKIERSEISSSISISRRDQSKGLNLLISEDEERKKDCSFVKSFKFWDIS